MVYLSNSGIVRGGAILLVQKTLPVLERGVLTAISPVNRRVVNESLQKESGRLLS
jgi:hypothetical protein